MILPIRNVLNNWYLTLLLLSVLALNAGCTKIVQVDIADADPMLVVEGSIRNGEMPVVLLSESQGYFAPTGNSLEGYYLGGAEVSVSVDGETYLLDEICTSDIPLDQLESFAAGLGVSVQSLMMFPLCAYTSLTELALIGTEGKVYDLHVVLDDYEINATSKLNVIVPIEESFFFIPATSDYDSLGQISTTYTDPDTLGNAYRWSSMRINQYPQGHELAGMQKDNSFIYPMGSPWDDSFINGQQFTFSMYRYPSGNESNSEERGFWKTGDTVLVRLETIDVVAFDAVFSFESAYSAQLNPFAPPTNVLSNIEGGLGWWIAYGASVDTVFCGL
tara:strand:+ start:1459 stop:2454 length:996 start_codon:yes stop_codon:yes gene_type:complete